ncbi:hypothetical protein [Paenibacillus sp. URB8-2]|uniref:hypothetical protein n=1 Tax=Paenibacillus sp. URB8-2 TaxID=2741301 RepID=UPI0015B9D0A2|nr:hypothetical protein [Paenibacillus sp. URB8-2]BCG59718.1 hypothetical protein PUR_31430 [Paenibacillus sp. URB8-2]
MGFRKPISTLGGLNFWENINQNKHFIMQKHKTGFWPYKYRILMRENRMEIANSNDLVEINYDWDYLLDNAVPQLDQKIDWLNSSTVQDIVLKVISSRKSKEEK